VEQLVAKTRVKRYAELDSIFPMRDPLWQDTWYLVRVEFSILLIMRERQLPYQQVFNIIYTY